MSGLGLAPYLLEGAFASNTFSIDDENRIYHSPLVREYYPDSSFIESTAITAKLNANENPYGPSSIAILAAKDSMINGNRYAWKDLTSLISKIAQKESVTEEYIMMGPGSSDLLEKVAMVLFMQGGNVVSADPSYMSLIKVAEAVGATWKSIPCKKDWSHDLSAMERAIDKDTKLVYICNPNNPAGSVTSSTELLDFCSRVSDKVPIFIDEAYLELAGSNTSSMVGLLAKNKNVIIARTFSKVMGMAGLRIGYIAALPSFLERINAVTRGGMGLSVPSIAAANAAMDDVAFQKMSIEKNDAVKAYVCKELTKLGYSYIPSYTNFILFPVKFEGLTMLKKLNDLGVSVRAFDIMNQTYCRVSIGTMEEMKTFVSAFATLS